MLSSGTEYLQGQRIMYIALEYVYGCTLSQLLRSRQALSMGEGLEILLPVVEGLSEVHAHRYVHLDMKPGNILLDTQRRIKLADFGLTRRNDQYDSGVLMGTPAYVAPEILDPQGRVGAPADIFALGVMMYRIFSGRLPFTGLHNDQQVLYHNANIEMPPITEIAPGIDPDIAGIIRWCTRKQADARPEDATELFTALSEIAQRMTPKDRAWRSPHLEPPELALWDEVGDIAERSGMAQMVRDTPISAYGSAVDLILDVDAENSVIDDFGVPLSPAVHEQGHIGIGPEPHGPDESLISPHLQPLVHQRISITRYNQSHRQYHDQNHLPLSTFLSKKSLCPKSSWMMNRSLPMQIRNEYMIAGIQVFLSKQTRSKIPL